VGEASDHAPTRETSFNLASVTKPFTALCVARLKETGRVTYAGDVRAWLPRFPYAGIAVRHLLAHTSGLAEYFPLYERLRPPGRLFTNQDLLELLVTERPAVNSPPGARYEYCNTNYALLGLVIDAATGMPATEYVRRHVLEPAGMTNAFPYRFGHGMERPGMAEGFEFTSGGLRWKRLRGLDGVFGDGNLYASISDLRHWARALRNETLARKETLAEALAPESLNDGTVLDQGLGWKLDRERGFAWHQGTWAGFRNYVRFSLSGGPDVFFLSNSSFGGLEAFRARLAQLLADAGSWGARA
jgi:CubicO group peptidase (beta-lactamase class C family)